ncbi:ATP-binding cassette domain-containing protein [Klebsiella pneumoniae]|uniref:ATP-binding cassette domain-containing protein n=1 Tax=Klebsiella pneumoniae TaxID=573 RepID=A0A939NJZ4_KLEPN|nr:ATP-binding cassette domain-containing protein [Klebsiella pneumoniae]
MLHGIDTEVQKGEVVAIIGPSGSGKTTLLRSINLLEQPESGTIRVGDVTIDAGRSLGPQKGLIRQLRQHVGFVFQNFNLFPHRTVLENIIEGPVIVKVKISRSPWRGRANCWRRWGSAEKRIAIRAVSGGQQQQWLLPARWLCVRT